VAQIVVEFRRALRTINDDVKNAVADIEGEPVLPSEPNRDVHGLRSTRVPPEPVAEQLATERSEFVANRSDDELIGRITPSDVARAEAEVRLHNATLQELVKRCRESKLRLRYDWLKEQFATSLSKVRSLASSVPLGRVGAALLSTTLITAFAVVATAHFTLDGQVILMGATLGLVLAGTCVVRLFYPSDDSRETMAASARKEADALRLSIYKALEDEKTTLGRSNLAMQTYNRLRSIAESRTHRLLISDWRCLRGHPFEDFLQAIFENLGFHVDRTKLTGDQGADLILTRDNIRIAVQAKGYAESVGNGAVQEALAGMSFYRCQRCAVITNSTFTASARELAGRINCSLIDCDQIPDLIRGKLGFFGGTAGPQFVAATVHERRRSAR
jgi:restriction system protein